MEHSSPLAAMQPPSVLFGHCFRSDARTSYPAFGLNSNSFNFKDLSMKKAHGADYFNVKGTSPTASLAADLSQNFHIDQSPQVATPRRSLFSSNLFGNGNRREAAMTTPPLPSSPAMDIMEMSPLPHKPPFNTLEAELRTPTIEISCMDTPMRSNTASPLQDSPLVAQKEGHHERRRPTFLRPSLARSKAQSFQSGMVKPAPESQAPPFKFQSRGTKTSLSTSASLEDMFNESPPQTSHVRGNGSPSAASIRKNSHPMMRPRKQCRRSLSMFENPEDVMVEKEASFTSNAPLQSICDIEGTPSLQLPHFLPEDQVDTLPRIDKSILVELIDGKYNDRFDNIMIIDCRFEYEYEGGHINGAVNYNDKDNLAAELFASPKPRTALVLHCEYSAHRAPIMAKYIRHQDRAFNVDHYPHLTYPDMYILDGGYSSFFSDHRTLCFPQNYVEMSAKEHEFACERGLGKVKQRSKLSRAQTFAFGQSPQMEDSPTGRCRNGLGDRNRLLGSPFAASPVSARFSGRRMLSY
ncbi:putative cell cycle control protein tyrosine phosphatase Mih1 [Aspergillus bombycis]|uniref:M-phase inducer phosphatase n=1 Tax=Aspergillus bombycis TaxID=109264 RepID=A0A1F8AFH8_9EURO|nr:putative cell cycle control protein tyrosine phosphatase Mih1 [Aspergillus bombycis]OGM50484.1 putative cell cycle control protein tyrosine phosphatase Mih1 [Aspergillus bombycis]